MARIALKNFNLTIGDREFIVVAGPNENEISAVVRAIAGLDATQGEILIDDKPGSGLRPDERDVALLSHDYTPYPGLSVHENLAIGLKQRRFADAEIKKRIAAVADALKLQEQLDRRAGSLLHAERQLVGLARLMARQPRVYLFDRPFAGFGAADASRARAAIGELQQRAGATIVFATNDPAEALALGTRTVIIVDGAVQQDAGAQAIYNSPANLAVAKYFGNPPMNLVRGTVKAERGAVTFAEAGEGTVALHLPPSDFGPVAGLAGKPVILGFRPEAVRISSSQDAPKGPGTSFRALVDRAERKGSWTDLYLRTGAHELICRTDGWESEGGRRLQFEVDLSKVHFFGENGRTVGPPT